MAAAYSMDLRKRVLKDADAGLSSKELAARYHVSRAWVDALKQRRRETGAFAPHRQTKFRSRVLAGQEERLAIRAGLPTVRIFILTQSGQKSIGVYAEWAGGDLGTDQRPVGGPVLVAHRLDALAVAASLELHARLP